MALDVSRVVVAVARCTCCNCGTRVRTESRPFRGRVLEEVAERGGGERLNEDARDHGHCRHQPAEVRADNNVASSSLPAGLVKAQTARARI